MLPLYLFIGYFFEFSFVLVLRDWYHFGALVLTMFWCVVCPGLKVLSIKWPLNLICLVNAWMSFVQCVLLYRAGVEQKFEFLLENLNLCNVNVFCDMFITLYSGSVLFVILRWMFFENSLCLLCILHKLNDFFYFWFCYTSVFGRCDLQIFWRLCCVGALQYLVFAK